MRRWVICFSHSRTCSAVTRSIWFQKLWEDSAAGSAGRRRVRTVWRYQSANCTLLVGDTARLALGGEDGIEQRDQIQTLGDVEQGGGIGESGHLGFERLGRLLGAFGSGYQVVDLAEVDLADNFGFAVDALAIAGVVIGVAADFLGGEARHT